MEQGSGTIAVIIGVKDRYDRRIINSLRSLRGQSYDQRLIDIIIVDYGSAETFHADFTDLCRCFNAVGVWTGINDVWRKAHCLNIAIKRTRSEYILISDVDMVFEKNYLEVCVQELRSDPRQALYCRMMDVPLGGINVSTDLPTEYEHIKSQAVPQGEGISASRQGMALLFTRSEYIRDINGYDESYSVWGREDDDLVKRLKLAGISFKDLGGRTSHMRQWHEKCEDVRYAPELDVPLKGEVDHVFRMNSARRNPNGWGVIRLEGNGFVVPEYPQDLPGTFWGVTVFFNPTGYANKLENYKKFRESSQRQGLNLLAVELGFGDKPFELVRNDADILIQLRGSEGCVLWQKEALLNVALKNLPEHCDKIAWLDCDILFKNDRWVDETAGLLERYVVVQPYEVVVRMDRGQPDVAFTEGIPYGFNAGEKLYGLAYAVAHYGSTAFGKYLGHSGYAWAARKDVFDQIGFYDRLILGSADTIMGHVFYGNENEFFKGALVSDVLRKDRDIWAKRIHEKVNSSVFYVSGAVFHLWHGDYKVRKYNLRQGILRRYNFNLRLDIRKNSFGFWEWASNKPRLHQAVKDYFIQRNEDGCPQSAPQEVLWSPLEAMDDIYLDFIAMGGAWLRKAFPHFYLILKPLFPDRFPGQRIGRFYLTSLAIPIVVCVGIIIFLFIKYMR